jgi:hypothetical protein
MRLRIHAATANDELVTLVNEGYDALSLVQAEYRRRKAEQSYDDSKDVDDVVAPMNAWAEKVVEALDRMFPTPLERNVFLDPEVPFGAVSGDYNYQSTLKRCRYYVRGLNRLRLQSLPEYTDLPLDARLYVEDIDSFRKVRDVNPATVLDVLKDGYLDRSEDSIHTFVDSIIREAGGRNIFADSPQRYPQITLAEVARRKPDIIILPTEPYHFVELEKAEFEVMGQEVPAIRNRRIHIVEGELLSWYGPRVARALITLSELFRAEPLRSEERKE